MQKIEIVLNGPEEERCAALIESLADGAIEQFNVSKVRGYCGKAPLKKGNSELLVPDFMKANGRKRIFWRK